MGGFRTFAATRSGDKVAPVPAVRGTGIDVGGFSTLGHFDRLVTCKRTDVRTQSRDIDARETISR